MFNTADVDVFVDGVQTEAYSITATFTNGRSEDAVVILTTAVTGVDVELYGARDPRRENEYSGNSPDLARNLQRDLDALTATQQEQKREADRAIRVAVGQTVAFSDLTGGNGTVVSISESGGAFTLGAGPSLDTINQAVSASGLVPSVASKAALALITVVQSMIYVAGVPCFAETGGPFVDAVGKEFAPRHYVTPEMYGGGDGETSDSIAINEAWTYASARQIPCFHTSASYECDDTLKLRTNLTVFANNAIHYMTAFTSEGGFITNAVTGDGPGTIAYNVSVNDLIADGSMIDWAANTDQNTNLIGVVRGAYRIRFNNCVARKVDFGFAGGTGGGGMGGEQGCFDVVYNTCVMEDCFRGGRVKGYQGVNANASSTGAHAFSFVNCVWRRCGTAIFFQSTGQGGDDESDAEAFQTLVQGGYIEDCGHMPWYVNPLLDGKPRVKCGVFTFGGAQNVTITDVTIKLNAGYTASTDWRGRTGYPVGAGTGPDDPIGNGLSGHVGAIFYGYGRDCTFRNIALDGSVDAFCKMRRPLAVADIGDSPPTTTGPVEGWRLSRVRQVFGAASGCFFDAQTSIVDASLSIHLDGVSAHTALSVGVVGSEGTAGLENVTIGVSEPDGRTLSDSVAGWLARGNAIPGEADTQSTYFGRGLDAWGGFDDDGGNAGVTLDAGTVKTSSLSNGAHDHFEAYALGGQKFAIRTSGGRATVDLNGVCITHGVGTPEGAITAPVGSHYLREDGGAGTTFYVKESGTGNTGWVGK